MSFLLLDACAFFAGMALFDSATVMPVLLAHLGASDAVVGLARFAQVISFTLPSALAAHRIHGRRRHKSFLLSVCAVGRTAMLTLPIALVAYGASRPGLVLGWFFASYTLFWFMDAASAVSWLDIVAKMVPERSRGRFFGVMQTFSGIAALGSAAVVARILGKHGPGFPIDFAVLAALWCISGGLSLIALTLLREPDGHAVEEERPSFADYLRSAGPLLRRNPRVTRLIVARVLLDGLNLALPFYTLYAQRDLHAGLRVIGLFVGAQSLGRICTGPLLGLVSDRWGAIAGLRAVALAVCAIPMLALLAPAMGLWTLVVAFFVLGGVQDGLWMVASTALLESVSASERPLAVGVASLFQAPGSVYSPLGGVVAQHAGYRTVFLATTLFGLAGLLAAAGVPRRAAVGDG